MQDKYSGNRELEDLIEFVTSAAVDLPPQSNRQVFNINIIDVDTPHIFTTTSSTIGREKVWWNWTGTASPKPLLALGSCLSSSMHLGVVIARGCPLYGIN